VYIADIKIYSRGSAKTWADSTT